MYRYILYLFICCASFFLGWKCCCSGAGRRPLCCQLCAIWIGCSHRKCHVSGRWHPWISLPIHGKLMAIQALFYQKSPTFIYIRKFRCTASSSHHLWRWIVVYHRVMGDISILRISTMMGSNSMITLEWFFNLNYSKNFEG